MQPEGPPNPKLTERYHLAAFSLSLLISTTIATITDYNIEQGADITQTPILTGIVTGLGMAIMAGDEWRQYHELRDSKAKSNIS